MVFNDCRDNFENPIVQNDSKTYQLECIIYQRSSNIGRIEEKM